MFTWIFTLAVQQNKNQTNTPTNKETKQRKQYSALCTKVLWPSSKTKFLFKTLPRLTFTQIDIYPDWHKAMEKKKKNKKKTKQKKTVLRVDGPPKSGQLARTFFNYFLFLVATIAPKNMEVWKTWLFLQYSNLFTNIFPTKF